MATGGFLSQPIVCKAESSRVSVRCCLNRKTKATISKLGMVAESREYKFEKINKAWVSVERPQHILMRYIARRAA